MSECEFKDVQESKIATLGWLRDAFFWNCRKFSKKEASIRCLRMLGKAAVRPILSFSRNHDHACNSKLHEKVLKYIISNSHCLYYTSSRANSFFFSFPFSFSVTRRKPGGIVFPLHTMSVVCTIIPRNPYSIKFQLATVLTDSQES